MRRITIHEAKTHLSRLVEEAAKGRPFIIAKAGKPMVQVVPIEPAKVTPRLNLIGCMKDEIVYADEADRALDREIQQMFDESKLFPEQP